MFSFIQTRSSPLIALTLALTLPPTVHSASTNGGGVAIYNNCAFPVYSFTVFEGSDQESPTTLQPNQWYWEQFQYPSTGGVSMKLGKSKVLSNSNPITQLEYTITPNTMFYDVSNVDCGPASISQPGSICPFQDGGMFLHAGQGCPKRKCASGEVNCVDAYNQPKDDWATAGCQAGGKNLVMYLCRSTYLGA